MKQTRFNFKPQIKDLIIPAQFNNLELYDVRRFDSMGYSKSVNLNEAPEDKPGEIVTILFCRDGSGIDVRWGGALEKDTIVACYRVDLKDEETVELIEQAKRQREEIKGETVK